MAMEGEHLRIRRLSKFVKSSDGNLKIHTKSGVFEAKGEDPESLARGLLNSHTLVFGNYAFNPNSIDVIEVIDGRAKTSKGTVKGAGSGSNKGSSSDSKAGKSGSKETDESSE